jgi:hypothetical protein
MSIKNLLKNFNLHKKKPADSAYVHQGPKIASFSFESVFSSRGAAEDKGTFWSRAHNVFRVRLGIYDTLIGM